MIPSGVNGSDRSTTAHSLDILNCHETQHNPEAQRLTTMQTSLWKPVGSVREESAFRWSHHLHVGFPENLVGGGAGGGDTRVLSAALP